MPLLPLPFVAPQITLSPLDNDIEDASAVESATHTVVDQLAQPITESKILEVTIADNDLGKWRIGFHSRLIAVALLTPPWATSPSRD